MPFPSLALCIPAYNAARFLPQLLQSAQQQSHPFDEIWVYDDASEDDTAAVAAAWGANVIRGEQNRGCSWGKNQLAQASQCDWIHFHDADDLLLPNFVASAHQWMQQQLGPDVILFGYEYREADSKTLLATYRFDPVALKRDAIAYSIRNQINPFCGLYRRSAILACGGYDTDPAVLYNEDVAFHCRLAIAGLSFAADPTIAIINFRRAQSMSSRNQIACLKAQYHVMKKVAQQLEIQLNSEGEIGNSYAVAIAQRLWQIAAASAACNAWNIADACVLLAQRLAPPPFQHFHQQLLLGSLCRHSPRLALRLREWLIRLGKPHLRPHLDSTQLLPCFPSSRF